MDSKSRVRRVKFLGTPNTYTSLNGHRLRAGDFITEKTILFQPDPLSPTLDPHMVSSLDNSTSLQSYVNYPVHGYAIMVCPIFLLLSGILDILKKIWEYMSVHKGYLPVYFKEYRYPPPPPSPLNKPLQYMGIL